ncbi:N-acetylglucosamine repressor [Pleomorphomonas sp. T1.2MG-36]|nr:N-acetylglucosamine repressor [Pleomorphomonas sp. T1.2MG-36]
MANMLTSELEGLLYGRELDSPVVKVVRALSGHGAVSTSQIARNTGLARSTVSTILADLKRSNLVVEMEVRNPGPGRPAVAHSLNPEAGTCVGALLDVDEIRVIVADVAHNVVADLAMPVEREYSPTKAARVVKHAVDTLYKEHSLAYASLIGIGFALSAPLAPDGRVMRSSALPGWQGTDFRDAFQPVLEKPIFADSESNCAALAEMMWGAASGCSDFVLLKLNQAVSGAVVIDGKGLVGASGSAGEMGHIVVDPHGPLCRCGNRGCLELYCGAGFVSKMAADWLGRSIPVTEIVARAVQGDTGFRRLLADAGEAAGRGLSMVGAMINPPLFIISGILASAGELLLAPLRASYEKHSFVKRDDVDEIHYPVFKAGRFLDNDNCLGAAGLVLRHSSRLK